MDGGAASAGSRTVRRNLDGIDRSASRARRSTNRFTRDGQRGFRRLRPSVRGVSDSFRGLGRFAAGLGTLFAGSAIIRAADQYANLQGQLKLVTDSSENLAAVQGRLFDVAQATSQPLDATISLYTRLARATDFSQERIAGLTETINQAVTLSSAAPEAAQAALFQLGQGFAAGALRGEELNSVLEQTPELAAAIAEGLGVSVGELRRLGAEGRLTAELVAEGLENSADTVERRFGDVPLTVGRALTQLSNSFTVFVGQINTGVGVTGLLADAISQFASFLATDAIAAIDRFGLQIKAGIIDPILETADIFRDSIQNIGNNSGQLGSFILDALGNIPINIATIVRLATVEIATFIEGISSRFDRLRAFASGTVARILGDEAAEAESFAAFNAAGDSLDNLAQRRLDEISIILQAREAKIAEIELTVQENEARRTNLAALSDESRARAQANAVSAETAQSLTDLLERLRQQRAELAIQTAAGDDAAGALSRYRIELQLSKVQGGELEDAIRQANEALIEQQAVAAAAAEARAEDLRLQERAAEVIESLKDETERYNDSVSELQTLLDRGLITDEQFEAARDALNELGNATEDFFTRARENSQDILAGFLERGLQDLDQFGREFANLILRLSSQALAANIFDTLLGRSGQGSGGGLLGSFLNIFKRQGGGGLGAGQGAIVGENGPEIFVPTTGGRVIPNPQTSGVGQQIVAQSAPPQVNLSVVNAIDNSEITGAFQDGSGDQVLLNRISTRRNAFRRALGV